MIMKKPAACFSASGVTAKTAEKLQRPGPKTVIAGLTSGGICYVGTKQAYLHKGYEINAGFCDYYAGETIEDSLIKLADTPGRKEILQHFSEAEE